MNAAFKGDTSGRCNDLARGAVRLGFHDAGTWSKSGQGGGADGSFVLANEISRKHNAGLELINGQMQTWYKKWNPLGASMADLIQMAANVATVTCPLGPRVRSFIGRNDSSVAAPDGRLPVTSQPAEDLIAMFADKTFSQNDLVALLGAHSTSQQKHEDESRAGDPQDSSPGVWDVRFYSETLNASSPARVFKFASDIAIAQHPGSQQQWARFSDPVTGQGPWGGAYASAYVRMSVLGVPNINNLKECTGVLPLRIATFTPPDEEELRKFLATTGPKPLSEPAVKLLEGNSLAA